MNAPLHEPDWSKGIRVSRNWETKVERSLSMKESRKSVAARGLYQMNFDLLTLEALETQQLRTFFQKLGEQRMWMPFWPDAVELSSRHLSGSSILNVTATNLCDFASNKALIWNGLVGSEEFNITSLAQNAIGISPVTLLSYDEGKKIYPALYGRISKWEPAETISDEHARFEIEFTEMSEVGS